MSTQNKKDTRRIFIVILIFIIYHVIEFFYDVHTAMVFYIGVVVISLLYFILKLVTDPFHKNN